MKEIKEEEQYPILIAEDNPDSRNLLQHTLNRAGYEVVSVQNGRAALQQFKKKFFPIILTDWIMPVMDGLELCRAIRAIPSEGYVLIILLTAKDTKADIITGLEAGADDYLTKPFHKAELLARIKTGKRILELERSLKKVNEEIKLLSVTDSLTGCYNRGYLTENMAKEIKRARRYLRPLSLILCDIDHFKSVNDDYGHPGGDQVLKMFVNCISKSIREGADWQARYGGEEFVIVLPETNTQGALVVAERIRSCVSNMKVEFQGNEIQITASFGVTSFEPTHSNENTSLQAMTNQADKYLYQCKQEGRNMVIGDPIDCTIQLS